ncbi:MAG: hypothetical protein IKN71_05670 [Alphaproteobacteria bacterium]|nr:hypothetical protein [Alphaproteobacteria bacterium]
MTETNTNSKTPTSAKNVWSSSEHSLDNIRERMLHHQRKMREEVEFAETDFYEDNIYDEPEYWQMSAHTGKNRKH